MTQKVGLSLLSFPGKLHFAFWSNSSKNKAFVGDFHLEPLFQGKILEFLAFLLGIAISHTLAAFKHYFIGFPWRLGKK